MARIMRMGEGTRFRRRGPSGPAGGGLEISALMSSPFAVRATQPLERVATPAGGMCIRDSSRHSDDGTVSHVSIMFGFVKRKAPRSGSADQRRQGREERPLARPTPATRRTEGDSATPATERAGVRTAPERPKAPGGDRE